MWSIVAFGIFLLVGLSSAQNPYTLQRPSYCSTCFTNDQRQNYYCCFYFFRCCAESRLGSNNRKVTTPSPEYPGFRATEEEEEEHVVTAKEEPLAPSETKSDGRVPGCQKTGESTRSGATGSCGDNDGVLSGTNIKGTTSNVPASKTSENVSPEHADNSRTRDANGFRSPDAERTPSTSYVSAYGGRRYPYNVPRVYPAQQPSRRMGWRTSVSQNSGVLSGSDRSKISETGTDSPTADKVQQRRRTGAAENTGDVFWGRMEPVGENSQDT